MANYTLTLIDNDEECFDTDASSFIEFDVSVDDGPNYRVVVVWNADERGIPVPTITTSLSWTHLTNVLTFLNQGLDATGNDFYAELFYMDDGEPTRLSFSK